MLCLMRGLPECTRFTHSSQDTLSKSEAVSFSDPIDLISFGQRALQAIDICCGRASSALGTNPPSRSPKRILNTFSTASPRPCL